jgi:tetratricopeptide repeat protein 21B
LITTHDYAKAINYYEAAVKNNPNNSSLRHDLAELYTKLKRFEQAEKVLKDTLGEQKENYDYLTMINDVKIYMLMAKVHMGAGAHTKAADALQKAHDLQNRYSLTLEAHLTHLSVVC